MKKIIFLLAFFSYGWAHAQEHDVRADEPADLLDANIYDLIVNLPTHYDAFKRMLHEKHGFDYRIRAGFMAQRGAPGGHKTAWRQKYEIEANLELFETPALGAGSVQFAYEDINYWGEEASTLGNRLKIAVPMNEDTVKREYLTRLTYSHQFAGSMDWLGISIGQYVIGNFSKASYQSKPMHYFNNYAVGRNATKSNPNAGLGGYVTIEPSDTLTFVIGSQDTTNYNPQNISFKNLDDDKWTSFVYTSWAPEITDWGRTILTGWVSHSPAIKKYDGKQNKDLPYAANAWVVTARQDIGEKWTLIAKANGASGHRRPVRQSYAVNVLYNDPFDRNSLDQLGVGYAFNKLDRANASNVRATESIVEAYYTIGICDWFVITPDVQFYINPGQTHDTSLVTVSSIQAKFLF
ncbi:MAG: carbohydrate porin [Lactobacillales bacterium]|nr:carbohydrate porin [Lactobacillales bacterium]